MYDEFPIFPESPLLRNAPNQHQIAQVPRSDYSLARRPNHPPPLKGDIMLNLIQSAIRTIATLILGGCIGLLMGMSDIAPTGDHMPPGGQYAHTPQPAPDPTIRTSSTSIPYRPQVGEEMPISDRTLCPTEDSCTIDYHDGRWWIIPVIP